MTLNEGRPPAVTVAAGLLNLVSTLVPAFTSGVSPLFVPTPVLDPTKMFPKPVVRNAFRNGWKTLAR